MKKLVNICRAIHVKEFLVAFAVLFVSVVSGTTAAQAEKVNVSLVLKGGSSVAINPFPAIPYAQCSYDANSEPDSKVIQA